MSKVAIFIMSSFFPIPYEEEEGIKRDSLLFSSYRDLKFDFHEFFSHSAEELEKKYEVVECPYCGYEFVRWIDEEPDCITTHCSDDCQELDYKDQGF